MNHCLPFTIPSIAHSPNDTYLMSILQTSNLYADWVMSNFINIKIYTKTLQENFCPRDMFRICPYIIEEEISYGSCLNETSFIDFIEKSINGNKYIYVVLNCKYISHYKKDFDDDHNAFIYGYDNIKKIIYIADFFAGKFASKSVEYRCIEDSFQHLINVNGFGEENNYLQYNLPIRLLTLNQDANFTNSISLIGQGLEEFILSKRPMIDLLGNQQENNESQNCIYGLECFNYLAEVDFTLRSIKFLYDFYTLWLLRLEYMKQKNWVSLDLNIESVIINCQKECKLNLLLYLKFKNSVNTTYKDKIMSSISHLKIMTEGFIKLIQNNILI